MMTLETIVNAASTLQAIDVILLAITGCTLVVCVLRLSSAWRDMRLVRTQHIFGPRRIIADGWVRRAVCRLLECLVLFIGGVFQAVSPQPLYVIAPLYRYFPHLFIMVAMLLLFNTLMDQRETRQLRVFANSRNSRSSDTRRTP